MKQKVFIKTIGCKMNVNNSKHIIYAIKKIRFKQHEKSEDDN